MVLYGGFIIYLSIFYRKSIFYNIKVFLKNHLIIFLLFAILIISFLFSDKIYLLEFKDVVNSFILISFFCTLSILISDSRRLKVFLDLLLKLIPWFAIVISIVGLLQFFNVIVKPDFLINNNITGYPFGNENQVDYNFSLLPVFFGMICILWNFPLNNNLNASAQNLLLLLFSVQVFFSGSKRGIFLMILILVLLFIGFLLSFRKNEDIYRKARNVSLYFLTSLIVLSMITYLCIVKTPYKFKNNFLCSIGSKNIVITKDKITKQFLKYASVIRPATGYKTIYKFLWTPALNPLDPDSGWGSRIHKTIFPLTGDNVEIVPKNAKGYLMDYTCDPSYYKSIDLCESYSILAELEANDGDRYEASVFCYMSDNFEVNSVSLAVGSRGVEKNLVKGELNSQYNFTKKNEWQKLHINFTCKKGEIQVLLSFYKSGVRNFLDQKGEIIFAYPQIIFVGRDSSKHIPISKSDLVLTSYLVNAHQKTPDLKQHQLAWINNNNKRIKAGFLDFNIRDLDNSASTIGQSDPIRKIVSKFILEDTIYHGVKSNIFVNLDQSEFIEDRLTRWRFAYQIFSKEYTWPERLFGGGFNFLNWYGYYFLGDKRQTDYPHNPFLHILLYSGILGLSIYIYFLYKVYYYYIKYLQVYLLFFIFFLITFFFNFFSGGSPFDNIIAGFFVILPFFIHSIHKRELTQLQILDEKL
jgi:hypothetical protein